LEEERRLRALDPPRLHSWPSSAAAAALRDSEPRETSIAAAVCYSDWFGGSSPSR
jgi:hypothetical protein